MNNRADATGAVAGSKPGSRAREQSDVASAQQDESILLEGSRFGVYVIGPCIGRGGMARVYRAEHEGLKRKVALKMLTQGFERDASGRERFLREARIAAAIRHPNVVSIFDVGLHGDVPYLVMELLEGEDLEAVLARRGAMDAETLIDMAVPVIAGLAAVHDAGVVHRDLKPANIFLARGAHGEIEPKLLDFGISKSSWSEHTRLTAADGVLMGTPCYLSPEAISGGEMTALSDQYSLGVLMYECATGVNPFQAASVVEVLGLIKSGTHAPASRLAPDLPKRLIHIIERAKSVDPRRRYPNLRQLGRELLVLAGNRTRVTWALSFGVDLERAAAAGQGVTAALALPAPSARATESPGGSTSVIRLLRQRRRRPGPALAATTAAAILVAAAFRFESHDPVTAVSAVDARHATASLRGAPPLREGEETPPAAPERQVRDEADTTLGTEPKTPEVVASAPGDARRVALDEPANERAVARAPAAARGKQGVATAARSRRAAPRSAMTRASVNPTLVPASLEPRAADDLLFNPNVAGTGSDGGSARLTGTNQAPFFD